MTTITKQIQKIMKKWGVRHNQKELEREIWWFYHNLTKKTRNKFEARIESQLRRSKVPYEYEPIKIPYTIESSYMPDWGVYVDHKLILIETKGYFRPEDKRKLAAVKKQHPEFDIRIVFYSKVEKNVRWADKHGFQWAIGEIPREWLGRVPRRNKRNKS